MRERLEFYLRDALGFAYDVVNAVLAAGSDDVVDAVARAEAVAEVRRSEDFAAISTAFKRMKNILRQAAEARSGTSGATRQLRRGPNRGAGGIELASRNSRPLPAR